MEPVRDITDDAASTDPDTGRRSVAALRALAERLGVPRQTVHRKHGKRTGGQL
jgi:hypothetical protein